MAVSLSLNQDQERAAPPYGIRINTVSYTKIKDKSHSLILFYNDILHPNIAISQSLFPSSVFHAVYILIIIILYFSLCTVCSTCGDIFGSASGLRDHRMRERGEFRFSCDLCGQKFISKPRYTSHMKKHIGVSIKPLRVLSTKEFTSSTLSLIFLCIILY